MSWSFTSARGPEEDHINYLNYGGSSFQLVPTEVHVTLDGWVQRNDYHLLEANYRGHTFQLWNEGYPTEYALHYRHDKPTHDIVYLPPPDHAPDPMFLDAYPNSGMPYGSGPFDADTSRGKSPYQMYDRDMHHYSITRVDHPMMSYDADSGRSWFDSLGSKTKARLGMETAQDATNFIQAHVNRFPEALQGTTPRGEAMDPVQSAVLQGDNPKSRLISAGESKLASRVESAATAPLFH